MSLISCSSRVSEKTNRLSKRRKVQSVGHTLWHGVELIEAQGTCECSFRSVLLCHLHLVVTRLEVHYQEPPCSTQGWECLLNVGKCICIFYVVGVQLPIIDTQPNFPIFVLHQHHWWCKGTLGLSYYSSIQELSEVVFYSLPITKVYLQWSLFERRLVLQPDMVFHSSCVTKGELIDSKDHWDGVQLVCNMSLPLLRHRWVIKIECKLLTLYLRICGHRLCGVQGHYTLGSRYFTNDKLWR